MKKDGQCCARSFCISGIAFVFLFFVGAVFIGPFCFSVPSASNCVSLPVLCVLLLVVLLTSVLAASHPAFVVDVLLPGSHILNYSAPS